MMTHDTLPPRQKSQRVINKTEKYVQYEQLKQQQQQHNHSHNHNHNHSTAGNHNGDVNDNGIHHHHHRRDAGGQHEHHQNEQVANGEFQTIQQNVYPGLNDIADAFELFPQELVRYFTLLKEIDAKCVYTVPYLKLYIKRFISMDNDHPKRPLLLLKIRNLIKELMPSLEEKMHVASILADTVVKHVSRIEDDYEEIISTEEIPESVRVGPLNHPAMIMETKLESQSSKSAQSQRSESRREALAAKKLLNINAPSSHNMDDDLDSSASHQQQSQQTGGKKKRQMTGNNSNSNSNQTNLSSANSRKRKLQQVDDLSRPSTPLVTTIVQGSTTLPSVQLVKSKKQNNQPHQLHQQQQQHQHQHQQQTQNKSVAHGTVTATIHHHHNNNTKEDNFQEPVYCYCQQVSFGEMVGCDGDDCKREWFHLPCIGLTDPPKGKWYCNDCLLKQKRAKR